jgi:hypothetical protein
VTIEESPGLAQARSEMSTLFGGGAEREQSDAEAGSGRPRDGNVSR